MTEQLTHTHFSNLFKELFPSYLDGRGVWGRIDTWGKKKKGSGRLPGGKSKCRTTGGWNWVLALLWDARAQRWWWALNFRKPVANDLVVWPKASLQTSR